MPPPLSNPANKIAELLRGYYISQALYAAAHLGIADILARSPNQQSPVENLATATGTDADSLYRLLRALASEGIFEELPSRTFQLNPVADTLRADAPNTMRPAAFLAGETQYKVWTLLKDTLKSGAPSGFQRIFRQPLFDFLAQHPDLYANFNSAMNTRVAHARDALLDLCHINPGETILDIGGGTGSVLTALLQKHPASRGILLETPAVIAETQSTIPPPLHPRIQFLEGDFLHAIPPANVMLLVTVLHMFQDDQALKILRHCASSLPTGGRLYIAEALLLPPNEKDPAKWQDLNMLMMTGGRERTFEEFTALLHHAGFKKVENQADIIVAHASYLLNS